jgi:hypothetical protein
MPRSRSSKGPGFGFDHAPSRALGDRRGRWKVGAFALAAAIALATVACDGGDGGSGDETERGRTR